MAVRKGGKPLEPDDLPNQDGDGDHISMFSSPRQLSKKAALEPRLRCTEVDENGNVILIDGEFKKSELIARVRTVQGIQQQPELHEAVATPVTPITPGHV